MFRSWCLGKYHLEIQLTKLPLEYFVVGAEIRVSPKTDAYDPAGVFFKFDLIWWFLECNFYRSHK